METKVKEKEKSKDGKGKRREGKELNGKRSNESTLLGTITSPSKERAEKRLRFYSDRRIHFDHKTQSVTEAIWTNVLAGSTKRDEHEADENVKEEEEAKEEEEEEEEQDGLPFV
uniref:Uncharacterized protein n=1 Tax=Vespula pensylvanica TaxID=30213 RepID=A0A834P6N5_VESPE|nr:hypothetical protein H0235_006399 [Vespula pensylvanica]